MDQNCEIRIDQHLESRFEDIQVFMEDIEGNEDLPPFNEYGLCFDYVESGTFEGQRAPYFRYQISWGGPSEEFRFYLNGDIEFWFMDWFDGACRDVTIHPEAQWLKEQFQDMGMMEVS